MIITERLRLCAWRGDHFAAFARMHADPEVMADLGGPIRFEDSADKFNRYRTAYRDHGFSRWAIEDHSRVFLGYAGVMFRPDLGHPLGPHREIGWRLIRDAWGKGYAAEGAKAALADALERLKLGEILSYTGEDNARSQRVMEKLGLRRAANRDFSAEYPKIGLWRGLVWTTGDVAGA